MFSGDDGPQLDACPVCNQPKTTKKVTKIVSIGDKIAEMLASDELRDNLIQRQREFTTGNNNTYADIYDGKIFRHLYSSQAIDNDENILKIYLKIDVDGFTCSSAQKSMIMLNAVVLNLDSSER
jgi:hypothetical protein